MLTELRIQNFKAWKDTGSIRLAPLTVIFGANNAGKSSLGHFLLALKQTTRLADRKRALHLGDQWSDIDLGTFQDCLYRHNLEAKLEFTLSWKLPQALTIRDPVAKENYEGDSLRLSSVFRAKEGRPELEMFRYELMSHTKGGPILSVKHGVTEGEKPELTVEPSFLKRAVGRPWDIERPEKFYRFSDVTLARYQNADTLAQLPLEVERLFNNLIYLGPLREPPQRIYHWAADSVPDVGVRGEFAVAALLSAKGAGLKLNRASGQRRQEFDVFIAAWLKDLGVVYDFAVRQIVQGRREYEVVVKTRQGLPEVKLADAGFGLSQVLPAVVQAFYAPRHATVWMEQPEIHLHPRVQAELADVFISAVQAYEGGRPRDVQLIIESHSEHFLLRLQRRIAEERIKHDDVAVYFVRDSDEGAQIEELKIDMFGEIENWPEGFFGDEFGEIAKRIKAAKKREKGTKRV